MCVCARKLTLAASTLPNGLLVEPFISGACWGTGLVLVLGDPRGWGSLGSVAGGGVKAEAGHWTVSIRCRTPPLPFVSQPWRENHPVPPSEKQSLSLSCGVGRPRADSCLFSPLASSSPACVWCSRIAIFLEAVYEQTSVAPQHQEYLFEGHLCVLEPSLSAQHIAHTTASSPLTLFSMASEPPKGLAFRDRE